MTKHSDQQYNALRTGFVMISIFAAICMYGFLVRIDWVRPAVAVYEVCNQARMSETIKEHGCAELQDYYKIEFLCSQANTSPDNKCWTERLEGETQ